MQILLLGTFELRTDTGTPADVPGARLRALLAALALRPGQLVTKSTLIDWIWGENPPAEAPNALQRLVSRLRKALPEGLVEGLPEGYRLAVAPEQVDAVRFEQLILQSRSRTSDPVLRTELLRQALPLWKGAPLAEVGLQDSPAFEAAVAHLTELHLTAAEEWAEAEVVLGRGAEILPRLNDLAAAHPLRERLVATLMRALAGTGRANEALAVFGRTRRALAEELGADPSAELSELHLSLLRAPAPPARPRAHNLRSELTSFVGRETEVGRIGDLLGESRLVTLIGPGGCGKTRLATESARAHASAWKDGAWLVELASTSAGGDVAQAALAALGPRDTLLAEPSETTLTERVVAVVGEREMLLVLDNCEHVIEAAATFAHRLLGECRQLRILVTSREPLGITGEVLWPVLPLAVPDPEAGAGQIEASPAVRLLLDRARAVRSDLALDEGTAEVLAGICRALDGIPLAIELAAARLRTMTPDQLALRLNDRFRLLTGGSRTALPRHRTLHAVIDWSWQLLSDDERLMLRRLSVFSGSVSLEAAEAVLAPSAQALDLLTALTEKSLLVALGEGAPRYRMLGTIREYAAQRLTEAGEAESARRAHLAFFTDLAETAQPHLRRAEQLTWLARLHDEHDNLGAAVRAAVSAQDAAGAMRLAASAGWYWWLAGHKAEGNELVVAASRIPGEVPAPTRAMLSALVVMFLNSGRGDERDAAEWIEQAYELTRRIPQPDPLLGLVAPLHRMLTDPGAYLSAFEPLLDSEDPWVAALAQLHLGKVRVVMGHSGTEADTFLHTALEQFQALGERFGISFAHTELAARLALRGDRLSACEHYEQAIRAVTELGALEDVIALRARQAHLYWLNGDIEASTAALAHAHHLAEQATWSVALSELAIVEAELARSTGNAPEARRQLDRAAAVLGEEAGRAEFRAVRHDLLAYLTDDRAEAGRHRKLAYEAANEAGYPLTIAQVLVGLADLAQQQRDDEQAARLLAASAALRGLPYVEHPDVTRIEQTARTRLGEARYAEVSREGTRDNWPELADATLKI
ncbi:winged helix-turn-helix domain-containing protein [Kineosporia rhizophila]|uniref:BTAD domain-containing putative transcriptional regulator n=1 Tax=Kineosporia rhizophila TaxID=84633 RepID=UPI001E594867|nr:winged helix-turn-helix domain-containing protein [Kineosporia rhizophila]